MGHFVLKSKTKLHELEIGAKLPESDFATMSGEYFVQLEHQEEKVKVRPYQVKPGIWSINKRGSELVLTETSFTKDRLLESFVYTDNISKKVDCFFNKLHIYKELGIEIPKRAMLLYGPAGSGKSTILAKVSEKYVKEKDVAVILWKTDLIDPADVKEFVKSFEYVGVNRLIFIFEDIGGVEIDQVRLKSESSLLSLLDNNEKAFKLPTMIIATTNYAENLLENLANRPQRLDDKIKIGYPDSSMRKELFKFFAADKQLSNEVLEKIVNDKYKSFTPAHIKEIFVKSALYDLTLEEAIDSIQEDIDTFNNLFQNKIKMGIAVSRDYDYD